MSAAQWVVAVAGGILPLALFGIGVWRSNYLRILWASWLGVIAAAAVSVVPMRLVMSVLERWAEIDPDAGTGGKVTLLLYTLLVVAPLEMGPRYPRCVSLLAHAARAHARGSGPSAGDARGGRIRRRRRSRIHHHHQLRLPAGPRHRLAQRCAGCALAHHLHAVVWAVGLRAWALRHARHAQQTLQQRVGERHGVRRGVRPDDLSPFAPGPRGRAPARAQHGGRVVDPVARRPRNGRGVEWRTPQQPLQRRASAVARPRFARRFASRIAPSRSAGSASARS